LSIVGIITPTKLCPTKNTLSESGFPAKPDELLDDELLELDELLDDELLDEELLDDELLELEPLDDDDELLGTATTVIVYSPPAPQPDSANDINVINVKIKLCLNFLIACLSQNFNEWSVSTAAK
jgi:hypothetical protein